MASFVVMPTHCRRPYFWPVGLRPVSVHPEVLVAGDLASATSPDAVVRTWPCMCVETDGTVGGWCWLEPERAVLSLPHRGVTVLFAGHWLPEKRSVNSGQGTHD